MGEETDDNAAGGEESQSEPPPASPETVPPGFEPHRSPSPPPPGFESHRPPVPPPVSQESQLKPVVSSSQSTTQTRGGEMGGNVDRDGGSVTVAQESPSKSMASSMETAPPGWEVARPPSPPSPIPLPVSEESQLIPTASSSQALSLLNVAQTLGEETEGNENKDSRSVTLSKESPSKPTSSLPGTSPPCLESLRPPSPLPSPLVPTLFPASQEFQTKPASLPETTLPCWESHSQPSPHPSPPRAIPLPDKKVLGRDTEESSPSNHQTFEHSKQASSSEPTINLGQMVCGTCRALLSYPQGARRVQCPCCHTLNFVLEAHEICLAECGKCEVLLMYQHGAPAVRCSHCNHVTAIGEHNSRTLDSVLQGYPLQPQIPVYESTQLNALAVRNP